MIHSTPKIKKTMVSQLPIPRPHGLNKSQGYHRDSNHNTDAAIRHHEGVSEMLPEVGNATFLVYTLQKELKWQSKRQSDLTTDLDRPLEVQEVEAPRISIKLAYDSSKAVSPMHQLPLCAPRTPGDIPGTHLCYTWRRPHSHSAAGRIVLMKNPNDLTGDQICNLPHYSTLP